MPLAFGRDLRYHPRQQDRGDGAQTYCVGVEIMLALVFPNTLLGYVALIGGICGIIAVVPNVHKWWTNRKRRKRIEAMDIEQLEKKREDVKERFRVDSAVLTKQRLDSEEKMGGDSLQATIAEDWHSKAVSKAKELRRQYCLDIEEINQQIERIKSRPLP